jgi:hypothetical protein
MEESMRTGRSVQEVEETLRSLSLRLSDKQLPLEVINRQRGLTSQQRGEKIAMLNPAMFSLDPNKKTQADALKIQLVLEDERFQRQQRYLNDVSSWGSTDPILVAAVDKAKKTSGKADIRNVASAYIGDAVGDERKLRLAEFRKAYSNAALRQKDSMFGAPNPREAEAIVVNTIVDLGIFAGTLNKLHNMALGATGREAIGQGQFGMLPAFIELGGQAVDRLIPPNK